MTLADAPMLHVSFASLHVLLGHFGSALIHRLRYGSSPLVLRTAPRSRHRDVSASLAALSAAWAFGLVVLAYWPASREGTSGARMVVVSPTVSWAIAVAGLALMLTAQATTGSAFREGQDPARGPVALCATGLHRVTRNPIYLGSWTCLVGMTLWWPTPLLVCVCLAIGAGMHALVLEEERFLRARFGASFDEYARRVPRYIGRVR